MQEAREHADGTSHVGCRSRIVQECLSAQKGHAALALSVKVTVPQSQRVALRCRGLTQGRPVPGAHFLSGQPSQYHTSLYIFCPHFI